MNKEEKIKELRRYYCDSHGHIEEEFINHRIYSEHLESKVIELQEENKRLKTKNIELPKVDKHKIERFDR